MYQTIVPDARLNSADVATRYLFRSEDGAETWGPPEAGLEMPRIMSSVIRCSAVRDGDVRKHDAAQGRIASSWSQRHTVLSLIDATKPAERTWRAISAVLHLDKGMPVIAGNSQARALTSMSTSGGKKPGPPRAVSITESRQALFEEALPPEASNFASGIQSFGNLIVA